MRYKARLVVKGCSQRRGIDYEETFSPVVRYSSIRMLLALTAKYGLEVHQMDAVCAFLQSDLKETIYMEPPAGYSVEIGKVCKLNKALYGLKQTSRVYNMKLSEALNNFGLVKSAADSCVFHMLKDDEMLVVAIYVDDLLIFSNNTKLMTKLKTFLTSTFKMKDIGKSRYVLGIQITRKSDGSVLIDQSAYVNELLARYGMSDANPVSTPMDCNQVLTREMCAKNDDDVEKLKNVPYQEVIGSILYLAQVSRPDIQYAVNKLSQFNNNYGKAHWLALKRVLR